VSDDLLDFTEDNDGDWILGSSDEQALEHSSIYPVGYAIENAKLAYKLCLLGATDVEIADFFEIDEPTLIKWRNTVPEFARAILDGKDRADANVANAMYQRAIGCSHKEDKVVSYLGDATIVRTEKHYPPDVSAGQFWLMTRQRDKWGKNALGTTDDRGFIQVIYPEGWDKDDDTE